MVFLAFVLVMGVSEPASEHGGGLISESLVLSCIFQFTRSWKPENQEDDRTNNVKAVIHDL